MAPVGVRDVWSYDRRRWRRVKLSAPVRFGKGAAEQRGALFAYAGQATELGTGGVTVTSSEAGPFAPGEILTVEIAIQWESRRLFPFSRIVGPCRVVRVKERHLVLAFCEGVTLLGSIGTP